MRKLGRWTGIVVAAIAVLLLLGVRRDRPAAEVEARHAAPPSRFVQVDGMRVHYRDRGAGSAIVLLHGSSSSLFTWEGWAAALAPEHRVISLDLPGHGLTGPHPEGLYSLAEQAEFVDHFAAALHVERFSVAGNSMGGGIAWHYALAHPDKVDKLILVDALAYPQQPPALLKLFAVPVVGRIARWVTPRFTVARSVRDVYGDPSRVTEANIDRYDDLLLRDGNREATRERLSRGFDDGLWQRLGEIRAPTLILWGSRDRWILPEKGTRLARDIPGARLITLDGLGHVPMEEDPIRSVAPVLAFLR
jgi:pimeloyl-ACP methyl ester carboxylesterase